MLFSSPLRQSISKYKNKQYKDVKISQYSQQFQSNVQLNSNNFKRFYSAPSILRETDISSIITPNVDKCTFQVKYCKMTIQINQKKQQKF